MMVTIDTRGELSLEKIAGSGQTFRWRKMKDGAWRIPAFHRVLYAREDHGILSLSCSQEEYERIWRAYFDMDTDYAKIRESIPEEDAYMRRAAEMGRGIRILRQDPWEMTVTFIISQRKNIPAIKLCVEKLCRVAGKPMRDVYDFPSPEAILGLTCNKALGIPEDGDTLCSFKKAGFSSCSLGYRMPYVRAAAEWMHTLAISEQQNDGIKPPSELSRVQAENMPVGSMNKAESSYVMNSDAAEESALRRAVNDLQQRPDDALREKLLGIRGVGEKVAACIMLFGFHRTNAFPVDVWMKRALAEHYPEGFDLASYAPYAGIMQQYMFVEARESAKH
ncbi:MAG: DNA-3-methyladenine glycosylase family protein [Chordicoccus sp.]